MNRPSFQFYPADWLGNTNLRRCTHEEKGAWMDVMCLLHDSADQYGALRWPLCDIARAVGCTVKILQALIDKGVLKGADTGQTCEPFIYVPRTGRKDGEPVTLIEQQEGPIWFSSRMVRDEYVRQNRGKGSRFGPDGDAPETTPKGAPKPPFGDGSSSSSSSSPSEREAQDKSVSRSKRLTFTKWAEAETAAGRTLIAGWQPLTQLMDDSGLDVSLVNLAWAKFKDRYTTDANYQRKTYIDWRATFLNSLRDNWFGLWFIDSDNQYQLTSKGDMELRIQQAHEQRNEATA